MNVQDTASITIEGIGVEDHWISSDLLSRVVSGFQNVVWVLGFSSEDLSYGERFRLNKDLKKKYTILWGPSAPGSYVQSLRFPSDSQVGAKASEVLEAIASGNLEELKKNIPDSRLRNKLYQTLPQFLPQAGEGWVIKYHSFSHTATLDVKASQTVQTWRSEFLSQRPSDEFLTIKGDLLRIDFEAKSVEVRYPPTKRPLKCYYLPEIEDSIVESRKDLIEVTGKFELDRDGFPDRLAEVSSIRSVDLSDMILPILEQEERKLEARKTLIFNVKLDEETKQFYLIEDEEIGVDISACTREELLLAITDQIFFLWDTYASNEANIASLTEGALELRQKLLEKFREI